jgi:AcrR family transcriptional regulator
MRRVATEIGVPTMSLYRHVADKDDLLLKMMDAAFGECRFPAHHPGAGGTSLSSPPSLRRTAIFAPHRLTQTITEMQAAQGPAATPGPATPDPGTQAAIADCDTRRARYQAALDAGADPPGHRRMDPAGQSRTRRRSGS